MQAWRKAMEQRQVAGVRVAQVKKTPKRRNSGLLDQYKHNNYNFSES